jgi:hypothetical protein
MSFPRLSLLVLGLPLLAGGCAPAVSYGADGISLVKTGKSTSDHLISMVSKKDCALWRMFRNENVCHERPPGAKDPYDVNYDSAERMPSEDGASYAPPLRQTVDEPASSWTSAAYDRKPETVPAAPAAPPQPVVAATEPAPPPSPVEEKPVPTHKPATKKAKAAAQAHAHAKPVRKSPSQAASDP